MLADLSAIGKLRFISLRYFNAAVLILKGRPARTMNLKHILSRWCCRLLMEPGPT